MSESKGVDSGNTDEVLQLVMQFATGMDFERSWEDFAEKHHKKFLSVLDLKDGEEHPLEWHDVYLEYLHTFEAKIERFIESSGYRIHDFYEKAREIIEDGETFGEVRFFLEALLATAEYEAFLYLMKGELHRITSDADYKNENDPNKYDNKIDAKD